MFKNLKNLGKIAVCSTALMFVSLGTTSVTHAQISIGAVKYDKNSSSYKQAAGAFKAAGVIVLGREINTYQEVLQKALVNGYTDDMGMSIGYFTVPMVATSELVEMFGTYDKQAPEGEKIADGIKFTDAVKFLKADLQKQSAYQQLFGSSS